MTPIDKVPRLLIAGIGNILLQDDGFGPQAIARLQSEYEFGDEVELLDLGTPALDFVDYLAGRDVVILLDALSAGGEPGEVIVYRQQQLRQFLPGMRLSAHQPCLHETLFAAEASGIDLKDLRLIGVVGRDFDVGTELSEDVKQAIPRALVQVCEIVQRHGVVMRLGQALGTLKPWWNEPLEEVSRYNGTQTR